MINNKKNAFFWVFFLTVFLVFGSMTVNAATVGSSAAVKPPPSGLNLVDMPQSSALPAKELESARRLCRYWLAAVGARAEGKQMTVTSKDLFVVVSTGEYSCDALFKAVPGVSIGR